jgi:hypothetical protein
MTAQSLPPPSFAEPIVTPDGMVTRSFRNWITGVYNRLGQETDKVDAAHALATGAVPQGTEVIASGGLQIGGSLGGNIGVALYAAVTAVAMLPATSDLGDWAYAIDGRKNGEGGGSGTGTPVWWDGAAWKAPDTGATVAA